MSLISGTNHDDMKIKILVEQTLEMAGKFKWSTNWYKNYGLHPLYYNDEFTVFDVGDEPKFFLASMRDGLDHEVLNEKYFIPLLKDNLEHGS